MISVLAQAQQLPFDPGPNELLIWAAIAGAAFALHVYYAVCLQVIAAKTQTPNGWLAWIPGINLFLMASIGRMSAAWALAAFIPCLNLIAVPVLFSGMATARGKPGWLGILVFVPVINLLLPLILAMGPASAVSPVYAAAPVTGPRHCPSCGAPAASTAAFCAACGRLLPPVVVVAAPAAGPPLRKSSTAAGCLMVLVVLIGLPMLACCGVGGWLWFAPGTYQTPVRQPPRIPAGIAGTRIAFPRDSDPLVAARPTMTVSQTIRRNADGTVRTQVAIPSEQLPPGLDSQSLATEARSITSATYRPLTGGAAVNIHALEPESPQSAQNIVDRITQANPGSQPTQDGMRTAGGVEFARWKIPTGQSETTVMQSTQQPLVIIIYAPTPEAVPLAARLTDNVGNSQGLNNPENVTCIETLPAEPPAGFELLSLFTWIKAETDPNAWRQAAGDNRDMAELLQSIYAILPEVFTFATYTDPETGFEQEYAVGVCTYPSENQARVLWTGFSWTAGTQAKQKVSVAGTQALVFQDADGYFVVFWKGSYIVFLHAPADASLDRLRALADSLQL